MRQSLVRITLFPLTRGGGGGGKLVHRRNDYYIILIFHDFIHNVSFTCIFSGRDNNNNNECKNNNEKSTNIA